MKKKVDRHQRVRSVFVGFRLSPEESKALDERVRLSGLTKREYVANSCFDHEIVVVGNPRVHKALATTMAEILQRLEDLPEEMKPAEPEFWETVQLVAETMIGLSKQLGQKTVMKKG